MYNEAVKKGNILYMEKVDIMLKVPALGESYEMQIPSYIQIGGLLPMLVDAVASMSGGIYQPSGQEFLCSPVYNCILADDKTLEIYKIQNGDCLVLI